MPRALDRSGRRRTTWYALGALALVACSDTLPGATFPAVPLALECGEGIWRASLGPNAAMPEVWGVQVVLSTDPKGREHPHAAGLWNEPSKTITFVADRIGSADAWCRIAAHELGHAMGLEHASSPALMASTPSHKCIGENDVEACEARGIPCRNTCAPADDLTP
jgi:hypothetical protein